MVRAGCGRSRDAKRSLIALLLLDADFTTERSELDRRRSRVGGAREGTPLGDGEAGVLLLLHGEILLHAAGDGTRGEIYRSAGRESHVDVTRMVHQEVVPAAGKIAFVPYGSLGGMDRPLGAGNALQLHIPRHRSDIDKA